MMWKIVPKKEVCFLLWFILSMKNMCNCESLKVGPSVIEDCGPFVDCYCIVLVDICEHLDKKLN